MKTTTGLSSGSILLRRVQRHAEMATLWQLPAEMPGPGQIQRSWEEPGTSGLPAIQPDPSTLDAAQDSAAQDSAAQIPSAQTAASHPRASALPQMGDLPAPPAAPVPGFPSAPLPIQRQEDRRGLDSMAPTTAADGPAQTGEPPPAQDRDWKRLQAILSAHRKKQASATLAPVGEDAAPAPAEPTAASRTLHAGENQAERSAPPELTESQPAAAQNRIMAALTPARQPAVSRTPPVGKKLIEESAPAVSPGRQLSSPLAQEIDVPPTPTAGPPFQSPMHAVQAQPEINGEPIHILPGQPQDQLRQAAPPATPDFLKEPAAAIPPLTGADEPFQSAVLGESPTGEKAPVQPVEYLHQSSAQPGQVMRAPAQPTPPTALPLGPRERPRVDDFTTSAIEGGRPVLPGRQEPALSGIGEETAGMNEEAVVSQPAPLEAVWPVLRRELEPTPGGNIARVSAEEGAGEAAPLHPEKTTQQSIDLQAAGQPAEVLPPRGPRPDVVRAAPFHTQGPPQPKTTPTAVEQRQAFPPRGAQETAAQGLVHTSIGPLPADLWELVGETPPTHPAPYGIGAPGPEALPAGEAEEIPEANTPSRPAPTVIQAWTEFQSPFLEDERNEPPQAGIAGQMLHPEMESGPAAALFPQTVHPSGPVRPEPAQQEEATAAQEAEISTQPASETPEPGQPQESDLADLVRQVYTEIRRRLALEWERSRR